MRHLKIGARLAISFTLLLAMMIGLTTESILVVSSAQENLTQINQVNGLKQRYAINYRGSVHDRAIAIRDLVLLDDVRDRELVVELIQKLNAAYAENEVLLLEMLNDPTTSSAEELEIHERIEGLQAQAVPMTQDIINLMNEGQQDRAKMILTFGASEQFANWLTTINEFIDLQATRNQAVEQQLTENISSYSRLALILLVASLTIAIFAAFMVTRSITAPLLSLSNTIRGLASGDSKIDEKLSNRKDQIGMLAQATTELCDAIEARNNTARAEQEKSAQEVKSVVSTLSGALEQLSSGDLNAKIDREFPSEYEKLRRDFNDLSGSLLSIITTIGDATFSIHNGSSEIAQSSNDLSNRTESQAATLEETAAALDELTTSVSSAAENATNVAKIVAEAQDEATSSGQVVQNAVAAMTEIEQSSTSITQIISVIDDIAFQTNLLALNAGVEAARAGEAGRGFAVVASEVRALAQRSSDAAMEIKTLISTSGEQVEQGVQLVGKAGEALQSIVDRVGHISTLINDIATGAEQQSTGLGEINIGMTQLDQVTQQNAAMVEQSTAASHLLEQDAVKLADTIKRFDTGEQTATPTLPTPQVQQEEEPDPFEQSNTPPMAQAANGDIWQEF
ncbi:methyl-accepting chemotaxis protein [Epibacterium ulvae]|uniref:methyl-accepting chemotaxis protein n=1 Tax=Epibacterium ulvae TaxID=1156985 RepID=UPI0024932C4D|nr:methyl-accepting chemotaxis protein [Epibacterium ulvae]